MESPEHQERSQNSTALHETAGWQAALRELRHQAAHLEARGAHRAAVTLYDAVRIASLGGLNCGEHAGG